MLVLGRKPEVAAKGGGSQRNGHGGCSGRGYGCGARYAETVFGRCVSSGNAGAFGFGFGQTGALFGFGRAVQSCHTGRFGLVAVIFRFPDTITGGRTNGTTDQTANDPVAFVDDGTNGTTGRTADNGPFGLWAPATALLSLGRLRQRQNSQQNKYGN